LLKEARYKCWGFGYGSQFPEYNVVVYAIIDGCCYFSGIERERRTSTINAAESIIKAISEQEGVAIERLRWFDLQTHLGYRKGHGEYELDEVLIGFNPDGPEEASATEIEVEGESAVIFSEAVEDFTVTWQRTDCPPEVLVLFKDHVGP